MASFQRLYTLAEMLIKGEATADIGADHGILTRFLVEKAIASKVIASEYTDGPYQRLQGCLKDSPGQERIEIRQGDGLAVLKPGEVVNVVLAGLGGEAMVKIIAADYAKARSFKRYVFQPMSRVEVLRKELCQQGWPILEERLIDENGRLFVALSAYPGTKPYVLSPLEIDIGPLILRSTGILWVRYLRQYLYKYKLVYTGLLRSRLESQENLARLNEYLYRIKQLEAILFGTS